MKNDKEEKELRRLSFLAEVASLYYEKDLTQSEIAERMFISRSRVSRLLKESKEKGLVTVKINFVGERYYELEQILSQKFGLKDARILNSRNKSEDEILQGIGHLAAQYLQERMTDGTTLGISWGKTVYNTVQALEPKGKAAINVVQIMGAASSDNAYINARELISTVSKLYEGRAYYLNAPLYVEEDYVRVALKRDPINAETLKRAVNADMLLTGIGSMEPERFSHLWKGYLDNSSMDELTQQGAVGHLFAYFYNREGVILDHKVNQRIVGIDISDLKHIKTVIGVAGGTGKAEAILAALKGGFLHTLITDYDTANEVLDLAK